MGLKVLGKPFAPSRIATRKSLKTHMNMNIEPSTKWRRSYCIQDIFAKIAFLPRSLVVIVAAIMLLSSSVLSTVYTNAYYNFNSKSKYALHLNAPTMEIKLAMPNKTRNNGDNKPNAPSCKWAKYADWPYSSEFPGLLSPHRRKLLYVKNPKSSSSTTAHILQRYTSREGLVVGYPNFAGNEWTFQSEQSLHQALKRAKVKELDAIVSHIIYRKRAVDDVLGIAVPKGLGADKIIKRPFRVTSVREPLKRSWSMYMHGVSRGETAGDFAMGASTPLEFARSLVFDDQLSYAAGYRYGVDPPTLENMGRHYDHIVVSERVLESFVTLGPKLGLHASDLLFFSQKRHGFAQKITTNNTIDNIIRSKNALDTKWHRLANKRLDDELRIMPTKITQILKDIPEMKKEVTKVCGTIDPEDNTCLTEEETKTITVWDGNQMCLVRCIERWAQRNIKCK